MSVSTPSPAPVPAEQPVTIVQTTSGDSTVEQTASADPVAGAGVSSDEARLLERISASLDGMGEKALADINQKLGRPLNQPVDREMSVGMLQISGFDPSGKPLPGKAERVLEDFRKSLVYEFSSEKGARDSIENWQKYGLLDFADVQERKGKWVIDVAGTFTPAPAPTISAPIPDPNRPKVHKVFFPAHRGASVDAMVRFVTLDQVLSSVDPGHNKELLQPRGADEKALRVKVGQMLGQPEAARVIATAPTMSEGIPLVIRLADGEPLQSVSGTARLEFLKEARKNPQLWAEIQSLTQAMAAKEGQTAPPNSIPVFELQAYQYLDEMMSLADLRTSAKTLYTIADEANKTPARDASVAEQAQIDATRISFERDKLLPFINTGETGDFASASNDKFMSTFLNMVQVQAARSKSGRIVGDAAVDRATNALLAFTLREAKTPFTTIRQFIESAQTLGLRNVSEGIIGAIGPLVAQAATKPDLSIVIEIGRVATAFADYRNAVEFGDEKFDFATFALRDAGRGWTPAELKLITLFGNATSAKQIRDALLRYARVASNQRSEDRMLVEPPKKEDILEGKPAQFKGQIAEQTGLTFFSPSESANYQTPIQTLAGIPIPDNASTTGWTATKDALTLRVQEAGELLPTDFVVTTNGDTPEPTRGEVYVVPRLAVGSDVADVAKHIQERLFHGTSAPIESLIDYYGDSTSIYGRGFYTTDNETVGKGYTKKGRGGQPTLYEVAASPDAKLFDLDQPVPDWLRSWDDMLVELALDEDPATITALFDEMRALSAGEGISRDEVQDIFDSIAEKLPNSTMNPRMCLNSNRQLCGFFTTFI